MVERPGSLPEFEAQFPDDAACARWLFGKRWPDGFRCPGRGHAKGWELGRGALLVERARCRRQTSVTAGTVLHRGHLPLKLWFLAAWLVATHRNGMSARQLWLQLGLGSYETAWLLLRKLRRAMVGPEREPLAGLVEVDETSPPFRTKDDPVAAKPGRSREGKLLVAGGGRDRGQGAGPGPAGGDRGLLGRRAQRVRRRQRRRGQHRGERRLVRVRHAHGRQARAEGGRRHAGPPGAALGAPRVREREAVRSRRLPRAAPAAPPGLPRRVRLPVQPPAQPRRRLRAPARPQPHPPARHLPDADQPELTGEAVR